MQLGYFMVLLIAASFFISIWMFLFNRADIDPLFWNLLLAWIPIGFACAAHWILTTPRSVQGRGLIACIFGTGWLFFFPNTVYILTDFLHLSDLNFYLSEPEDTIGSGNASTPYAMDGQSWNSFFTTAFTAGIGLAISVLSLYIMHFNVRNYFHTVTGWLFVLMAQVLCGIGVFLGRFIRFNSWDILSEPLTILTVTVESIDRFMIYFTGGFTLIGMFSYLFFYTATQFTKSK
ncbi:DUF1361 domain-containing protein [Alkalicoccus halolimnae]|uniref:DUF1361 domain-containing protein n=1 Tax=Alkalicoccus halolimnae TaxID=1667239 RepID=A0A5C7F7B0_9BACI|nr:DUF1361 domain-containing protein [Alkalicoccus halolimnae]TXF85288.1 DUF1361 domain-containing protein [Alkalicoccus halolimnae]